MSGKKNVLLNAMEGLVFPFLMKQGFERSQPQHRFHAPNIFDFRRIIGQEVHCLDFSFDGHLRECFFVNIAEGPISGVPQYGLPPIIVPGRELCVRDCRSERAVLSTRTRLHPLSFVGFLYRKPFRLIRPADGDWAKAADRTVRQFIDFFPECEAWWKNHAYGLHLFRDKDADSCYKRLDKKYGAWNCQKTTS